MNKTKKELAVENELLKKEIKILELEAKIQELRANYNYNLAVNYVLITDLQKCKLCDKYCCEQEKLLKSKGF